MLRTLRPTIGLLTLIFSFGSFAQLNIPSVLENYSGAPDKVIKLKEAAGNLSGVVYNYDSDSYFVIQNNSYKITEYDRNFSKALRVIKLTNLMDKDTEDIAYLGSDQFAINMENNAILIFTLKPDQTTVDLSVGREDVQLLQLPSPRKDNKGIEGLCFTARGGEAGVFWAVQEASPKRVFMVPRPTDMKDVKSSRALKFSEPINADKVFKHVMSDLSGCHFNDKLDHLLVLSHESSRVMELTRTGVVVRTMDLSKVASQYEGITIGGDGELVLVSEPDTVVIYNEKKQP